MTFPHTIKVGSASVKIYRAPTRIGKKRYDAYLVRYHYGGKPIQRKFAELGSKGGDPEKGALAHAHTAAERINAGTLGVMMLTERDTADHQRAKELLAPFGKTPAEAAAILVEVFKELGDVPPIVAVRFYKLKHPSGFSDKTVKETYDELLKSKEADGVSYYWLSDLRNRLKRFCVPFGNRKITEVGGNEIDDWLRGLKVSGKTRNNFRGVIGTLFSFAKSRKYLPADWSEMSSVSVVNEEDGEIEIFTPDEMCKILASARPMELPFLCIGGFAGLRTTEVARLDWPRVKDEHIEVRPTKATKAARRRRLVPILSNLAEWLAEFKKKELEIWPWDREAVHTDFLEGLATRSGIEWRHNALRHSFISYRLAIVKSTSQVAYECGTSEQKIFTNYRELVTEAQAVEWFKITPSSYKTVTK